MTFLNTLHIAQKIVNADQRADDLEAQIGISNKTLRRHINEARHLGVDIITVREKGADGKSYSVYRAENAREVRLKGTLEKWLQLEMDRSVT